MAILIQLYLYQCELKICVLSRIEFFISISKAFKNISQNSLFEPHPNRV